MSNANDARKAHKILDDLIKGNVVLDEEREFLRRALPEMPKQKTRAELIAHVDDAWAAASGYEWGGNSYDPDVSIEDWLTELHEQLKGLIDTPAAEPAKPAHPEFLETEADYTDVPEGTIVASSGRFPWVKGAAGEWACSSSNNSDFAMSKIGRRNVIRWGWGNE